MWEGLEATPPTNFNSSPLSVIIMEWNDPCCQFWWVLHFCCCPQQRGGVCLLVKAVLRHLLELLVYGLIVLAPLQVPMGTNTLVNGTTRHSIQCRRKCRNKKVYLKTITSSMPRDSHPQLLPRRHQLRGVVCLLVRAYCHTWIHQRIWTRGLCLRYQSNQSIHSSAMCRTTEAHDIFRTAQMPEASSLHN